MDEWSVWNKFEWPLAIGLTSQPYVIYFFLLDFGKNKREIEVGGLSELPCMSCTYKYLPGRDQSILINIHANVIAVMGRFICHGFRKPPVTSPGVSLWRLA